MSFAFLQWLFAFMLQASLLGMNMYALICLSDLEADFINPYDLEQRLNKFVIPDYIAQALLTAALLFTGNWFAGALHLGMLLLKVKILLEGKHRVASTDVIRDMPSQKRQRIGFFVFYLITFIFVTYRLIESVIHSLLTPEGRMTAKKLFKDAASSLHGY